MDPISPNQLWTEAAKTKGSAEVPSNKTADTLSKTASASIISEKPVTSEVKIVPAMIQHSTKIDGIHEQSLQQQLKNMGTQATQLFLNTLAAQPKPNQGPLNPDQTAKAAKAQRATSHIETLLSSVKFITNKPLSPGQSLLIQVDTGPNRAPRVLDYHLLHKVKQTEAQQLTRAWLPMNLPHSLLLEALSLLSKTDQDTGIRIQLQSLFSTLSRANQFTHFIQDTLQARTAQKHPIEHQFKPNQIIEFSRAFYEDKIKLLKQTLRLALTDPANATARKHYQTLRTSDSPALYNLATWLKNNRTSLPTLQTRPDSPAHRQSATINGLSGLHTLLKQGWRTYQAMNGRFDQPNGSAALDPMSLVNNIVNDPSYRGNRASWLDNIYALLTRSVLGSLARSNLNRLQIQQESTEQDGKRLLLELPMVIHDRITLCTLKLEREKAKKNPKTKQITWRIHLGFSLHYLGNLWVELSVTDLSQVELHLWAKNLETFIYLEQEIDTLGDYIKSYGLTLKNMVIRLGERETPIYASKTPLLDIQT